MFPGTVHRRYRVAAAQRGTPDGHHEHEAGSGAQVPRRPGAETGQLRRVHALRALPRRAVARKRRSRGPSHQPRPRKLVVRPAAVLIAPGPRPKVRPLTLL